MCIRDRVERAHARIIGLIRPGLAVGAYAAAVDEIMKDALMEVGLLEDRSDDTTYRNYFPHAVSYTHLDVYKRQMFSEAPAFNQPIGNWNVSNVTNMSYMFAPVSTYGQTFNQPIGNWNVSKVTNMNSMFLANPTRPQPFNQPLAGWDTSRVTNMAYMFKGCLLYTSRCV